MMLNKIKMKDSRYFSNSEETHFILKRISLYLKTEAALRKFMLLLLMDASVFRLTEMKLQMFLLNSAAVSKWSYKPIW